jgi:hypothetical protein
MRNERLYIALIVLLSVVTFGAALILAGDLLHWYIRREIGHMGSSLMGTR